jgi:hypothetical protein
MSIQKVNHNVVRLIDDESIAAASGSYESVWYDTNGWTDKVVTYDVDSSGSIALTITADISPVGYYELNNKTATTDDYATITIASGAAGAVVVRVDSDDLDDLQRPIRSLRFKAVNADGSDASVVNVWAEGWS